MTQKNKLQFLTHLEFQMRYDLLFEITSYLLHIFQGNKIHKYIFATLVTVRLEYS